MPAFQQIIAVGHVGQDPEIRNAGGSSVLKFSLAVTEKWRSRDGNQQEHTEWFRCQLWGERGEKLQQYIGKGDPLMVVGQIRTEKYQDRDGNDRQSVSLNVREVQFLKRRDQSGGSHRQQPAQQATQQQTDAGDYGDNIPF